MVTVSQRLNEALALHRSGQLDQAIVGYRSLLKDQPETADALHLLGLALDQKGDTGQALASLEKAIDLRPNSALFHFNFGRLLSGADRPTDAEAAYRMAVKLDPNLADAHNNLGLIAERRGDTATAITAFESALSSSPNHSAGRVNLARVLIDNGNADQAKPHLSTLVAQAQPPAEAWFLIGSLAEDAGDFDAAVDAYRKALAIMPGFTKAKNNLGTALLGARRYRGAQEVFTDVFLSKRAPQGRAAGKFDEADFPARQGTHLHTCRYRLSDSADQLDYLIAQELIDPSWNQATDRFRQAITALDKDHPPDRPVVLEGPEADALADLHEHAIRLVDTAPLGGPAIGQKNDYGAIEEAYLAAATSITTIDNFLSPEALTSLRDYCRQSTIFFGYNATGYVTSYMADGFTCSLLYQIAEELQAAMPRVLGSRPLHNMWVYRHDNTGGGVEAHTDDASVTFNFWLTEDDANLNADHGGLIVYAKEQPLDWDWTDMNLRKNDPDVRETIQNFLSDAPEVILPHRENRAILFHSNLFHKSDRLLFRRGFENRRMNVTLLFGERGT